MRKFLLRTLFFLIPFLWWIYVSAQPKKEKDCSNTCFTTDVVGAEKISSTCTSYELKVSFSGACTHALSHYSIAIPCGSVQDIWNSQGWKQEVGTDPTTGIAGFKIDDISEFGEGSLSSFTVKFTLCSSGEDCSEALSCWQPQVAYKAGTCVNYQTLAITCSSLKASLEKVDTSCSENGSLKIVVEDGEEPFTFLWSDGSADMSRTDLPAGEYSVIVRDASGSEITLQETISEPDRVAISGVVTSATCNGAQDGAIDLTVTGGSGNYTYVWSNSAQTEDVVALGAGNYSVTVTDDNNCSATAEFTVEGISQIAIAGTHVKPDCNTANGSINLSVSGGSEPYTFAWSNGASTEDLDAIGDGLYTIVVTDNKGCSAERSFFIRENNTLSITGISTPTSCADDASGQIDITATGGTPPYTFSWSNGQTTEDISGLASGSYTVTVVDAKGCTATGGYTVSRKTFQVPKVVVQPTCHGEENGSIVLQEPIGGVPPFTYEWSTGHDGTSLTDLGPGVYSVTITDNTGCSRTLTTTITEPSEITASAIVSNPDCNTDGSFSIDLSVSGGTAPYTYEWSDGNTLENREGLTKGTYSVTITDAHGCTMTRDIVVEGESPAWSCVIDEPTSPPSCNSAGNVLTTSVTDADSYTWSVESSDGSWSITSGAATSSAFYTTGGENSTATFTLIVSKDGCTRTCSYTISACAPDNGNGGGEPGGEDPGDGEDPGQENPGEGGSETCEECFETQATLAAVSGNCRTYEMEVTTDGLCRHDLSHWMLAIPCGSISNYSNSEGWRMEFGKDPTTGLYGLKVDDISSFGKVEDSFTIRFTLCESQNCDLSYWDPTVAYKAGQCISAENIEVSESTAQAARIAVYPNPFSNEINFEWNAIQDHVSLEIIDQYGNIVSRETQAAQSSEGYVIKLESSSLPKGMYYYRMTVDGKVFNGKISKR